MNISAVPTVTLNDGTEMPQIGLGTWKLHDDEAVRVVREAIAAGYRHIDTAALYGNEEAVGRGIRDAIAAGDVTRDELFVTTKLLNEDQGSQRAQEAFRESLGRLGLEYIDLYMVHWPWPQRGLYVESFEAIAKLQGLGVVQSVGVANFYEEVLRELIERTGVFPAVNQVELHPGFSQAGLRALHEELGIVTEAWAPLGRGIVLMNPVLDDIAIRVGRTPAQVALRWLLQLGCSAVPKTAHAGRLAANLDLASFKLTRDQMDAITALDDAAGFGRIFADPREYPGEVG
ncbi:aldo/keto reductase [Corynebacterium halotolerans]|uniref:Putative oxidoreductase n=1 Tax=Corynebacterium halotolerans YIM 70093 = DSM 44683 TaxID=1121362 RepID=M1NWG5_9CORY|nr:aldo/keto reductase [Corynebacterium halotolerans]AGF71835.1 putative oxidoreductase [Corynebacterium halotolerans YIM 70093 = DSM 44683]